MKLPFMTLAAGAFLAVSCANAATATDNYTVTLPLSEDEDGLTAYIIDFDTSAKLDSTVVDGGKAIFKGIVTTPVFARVILDGNRAGQFVLEEGDIAFNPATSFCCSDMRLTRASLVGEPAAMRLAGLKEIGRAHV